jgi:plastocyanin
MRLIQLSIGALVSATLAGAPNARVELRGVAWTDARPEQNAVVWIDAPGVAVQAAPRRVVLDQRDVRFWPHVLAIRVGTVVEFPNNDRVFHNVFSFRDGKRFDLGLYPVGAVRLVTFDRPGLSRIFCNIHPNMAAYVLAVDSSYFAVSDEKGAFTIPPLPAGKYVYHTWRPGGSPITGSVSLDDGVTVEIRWP